MKGYEPELMGVSNSTRKDSLLTGMWFKEHLKKKKKSEKIISTRVRKRDIRRRSW